MAFKIKQERNGPELESARSKLDEALQFIIEKTEESPSSSDDDCNKGFSDLMIKREPSPILSPTKRPVQRTQRKRRRKDETLNKNANSYVMKLFDRAVDLTPFTEQTPLYPICRAWINNQSLYKPVTTPKEEIVSEDVESCEDTDKGSENPVTEDVYQLPPPRPLQGRDLRVPSPVPQPVDHFVICSDGSNKTNTTDALMIKHLLHWKAVRQKWKQAAKANEDRYKESGAVLKSMFEKAQCRDDGLSSEQWDTPT
uniref:Protein lin-37-like protein n=2 Tax=Parasteatoda tepidariorum TaxID=114398 RepID=A0A2L2Y6G7_PARTP